MKYVIIGGSAAAVGAVEAIRRLDPTSQIDLFSDEKTALFSRVLLPYYVAQALSKQMLNFRSANFFDEHRITPHIGVRKKTTSRHFLHWTRISRPSRSPLLHLP